MQNLNCDHGVSLDVLIYQEERVAIHSELLASLQAETHVLQRGHGVRKMLDCYTPRETTLGPKVATAFGGPTKNHDWFSKRLNKSWGTGMITRVFDNGLLGYSSQLC